MGTLTPKEPFNLAEFLSEKHPPHLRPRSRSTWQRPQPKSAESKPTPSADRNDDDQPE